MKPLSSYSVEYPEYSDLRERDLSQNIIVMLH